MNLYQLRYFVTLAKFQHYMKASEQLCITQPSLSHAISALEKELGVKLFEKDVINVILTKCGKNFLKDAEHTLQLLDSSVERLKSSAQGNGRLDIGLLPTLGTDFVPRLIRGFLTACPDKTIDFHFYNGLTADFLEDLKNQKYDFTFCSRMDQEPLIDFIPVARQELVVIVRNDHPLALYDSIELAALRDYALSTYRDTIPIGKTIRKILKDQGMKAAYSYDDEISIAGQINHSSKTAIVADTPFLKQFDNLKKIHLTDVPKDTRMLYMVYSKKNFITAAVEAFANFMVVNCLDLPQES